MTLEEAIALAEQRIRLGFPGNMKHDVVKVLLEGAKRYAFLRTEDAWGEDTALLPVSGDLHATGSMSAWSYLGETSGAAFDAIVDAKMADPFIALPVPRD